MPQIEIAVTAIPHKYGIRLGSESPSGFYHVYYLVQKVINERDYFMIPGDNTIYRYVRHSGYGYFPSIPTDAAYKIEASTDAMLFGTRLLTIEDVNRILFKRTHDVCLDVYKTLFN